MNVVNAVTLKGNINDPNIMKNNVTRLRLCVDGYNNTKDWFDIVCFRELGIQASKLNKGDLISVEGRLKNDVYIKKNENGEDENASGWAKEQAGKVAWVELFLLRISKLFPHSHVPFLQAKALHLRTFLTKTQ